MPREARHNPPFSITKADAELFLWAVTRNGSRKNPPEHAGGGCRAFIFGYYMKRVKMK
jgi:hypothetical protein